MSDQSKIEWTEATWNPVTGCSKVSQGCKNCYALREWPRLSANPKATAYYGREFTDVRCHPERLDQPLRWTKSRKVFVNSMSDLFHESVPFEFIASVFAVMGVTTRHTYQVLTKRPLRMIEFFKWALQAQDEDGSWHPIEPTDFGADNRIFDHWPKEVPWKGYDNCGPGFPYENVWLGVSVEDQATADERIPLLLETPAAVRWLSMEPLLGPVDLDRGGWSLLKPRYAPPRPGFRPERIQWVVVGGESGPKARPMHPAWVRDLRNQCNDAGVPFFFKQWGEWLPVGQILPGFGKVHGATAVKPGRMRLHYGGSRNRAPDYAFAEHGVEIAATDDGCLTFRVGKRAAGRELDGRTWDEYPAKA